MARILSALFLIMFVFTGVCYSEDIRATTEDGRGVILKKDGTWKFEISPKAGKGGKFNSIYSGNPVPFMSSEFS